MNDSLQDVISAAVENAGANAPAVNGAARRGPVLRAVETTKAAATRSTGAMPTGPEPAGAAEGSQLGRNGLRLAFWLCGFHETLRDRQRRGETLDQRETSLLALSSKDFALIRPAVIGMAVEHLHAVLARINGQESCEAGPSPHNEMEAFAVQTLLSLAARASALLRSSGPEAALSLFGGGPSVQEPLAIFQLVFSAAVGLAESFARLIPGGAAILGVTIEALGSEVERI